MVSDVPGRSVALVVLLAAVLVAAPAAGATAGPLSVDATPSGPSESSSTHAVTLPLNDESAVIGAGFNDVVIDYSVGTSAADVSNVGTGQIERIGIDRGDDDPGSQVDVRASSISSVSGQKDGAAVRIALGGNRTLEAGDEVVVVLQRVQNPQNAGSSDVEVTVNSQGSATAATGAVTYEQHDATVRFDDQSTAGDTITVRSVNLSEGGFVAIRNTTGAAPGEIRGVSEYVGPGTSTDVSVTLDVPVEGNATLVAQAYTGSNADRDVDFEASGDVDGAYRNGDDNVIGTDEASVTAGEATETPTATPTDTPTPADTATTTETDTPGFGPAAAAIAFLGLGVLAGRRS